MNEPLQASIIIDNYNFGRFLSDAIDSCLSQTYARVEIIVVDDGSTDNSRDIIANYRERVIPVLKENGGQASAFNAGFKVSRGDVIFFLDSDDMYIPSAVATAIEFFRDPHVARVQWPLAEIDELGRRTGRVKVPIPSEGDLRGDLILHGLSGDVCPDSTSASGGASAWARKFIENVFPIPNEEFRIAPDLFLMASAPFFGLVKRILEPQTLWRKHGKNSTLRSMWAFEEHVADSVYRWDCCLDVLAKYCIAMGARPNREVWKANSWWHQIQQMVGQIRETIPTNETFILVDEDQWNASKVIAGRHRIPFMERDGQYWGYPANDTSAILELERLHRSGANFIVFVWPYLWWLEYYEFMTGLDPKDDI